MARVSLSIALAAFLAWPAQADWFFRGTPNDWGTTAMDPVAGTSRLATCQNFRGQPGPRFKIDRLGDWAESYPPEDFAVAEGSYRIAFDNGTKQIAVEPVVDCSGIVPAENWYFRGTPNNWGITVMERVQPWVFLRSRNSSRAQLNGPFMRIRRILLN